MSQTTRYIRIINHAKKEIRSIPVFVNSEGKVGFIEKMD